MRAASLRTLVECIEPLLVEAASFLNSPKELASLGALGRSTSVSLQFASDSLWSALFRRRWPAFCECLTFQGATEWRVLYMETLLGRVECTLEVFDREKKKGFAMSAMAARIQYEARLDAYIARYLSASVIPPETIPSCEAHRLRFCPPSARGQLRPDFSPAGALGDAKLDGVEAAKAAVASVAYPYLVLQGTEGLQKGQGVELQWKMQKGSPFGWWYGHLEALSRDAEGLYKATITFSQFPSTSRWYRLDVKFGDSELRPCAFGGFTGGIRPTTPEERARWATFFPKQPVVF